LNTLGNILCVVFGEFTIAILYLIGSVFLMITIVGIPFAIETLKMANLALMPFGREAAPGKRTSGCLHVIMNIIWLLGAGVEIAVCHLVLTLILAFTIIGIPFARQHIKLAYLALVPFEMDIISRE